MASKGIRTKRIFISDIHMGDQQSIDPPDNLYPYGWFHQDRGRMLGDFLGLKLSDPEAKEVVILGDLFDLWVYPAELEPPDEKEHLCRIAHAYQNREVIRRLQGIAACDEIDLIYVQGNHDMWTSTMTPPCWKGFLNELFPGINTDYIECGGWNNTPPW